MRKWLGILTIAIYGVLSTGLSIHLHYCHGKLKHVAVASEGVSCCKLDHSCSSTDGLHASCCDNENISLELEADHTGAQQMLIYSAIIEPCATSILPTFEIPASATQFGETYQRPPPDLPKFILYSSLVLYA